MIKQLLEYVLLAHSDGHPITHLADYAVRYERLLRYPIQETLNLLAGRHVDLARAGEELRVVLAASSGAVGKEVVVVDHRAAV